MMISRYSNPVRFGAVFKNDPGGERSYLTFSYNQGDDLVNMEIYATGADAEKVKTARKAYTPAMKAYCAAKYNLLSNSKVMASYQIEVNIASSTHPNRTDEIIAKRKADDRQVLQVLSNTPGQQEFAQALADYEAAETAYRNVLKEMADKAQ